MNAKALEDFVHKDEIVFLSNLQSDYGDLAYEVVTL